MRILISGASGLVGSGLCRALRGHGHEVIRLIRRNIGFNDIFWSPDLGVLKFPKNSQFDIVCHLAGENLSKGLWTKNKKNKILASRVNSTRFLINRLSSLNQLPHTFISASAVGFYGNTEEDKIGESAGRGSGFLADVCYQWEKAAEEIVRLGVRCVIIRLGVVLADSGGIIDVLKYQSKSRLNIIPGRGDQYISWVSLADVIAATEFLLNNPQLRGVFNITAPQPVRAREFYSRIRTAPPILPCIKLPPFMLQLVLKDMAQELLLNSCRCLPTRLLESGFCFKHPKLSNFLEAWKANQKS